MVEETRILPLVEAKDTIEICPLPRESFAQHLKGDGRPLLHLLQFPLPSLNDRHTLLARMGRRFQHFLHGADLFFLLLGCLSSRGGFPENEVIEKAPKAAAFARELEAGGEAGGSLSAVVEGEETASSIGKGCGAFGSVRGELQQP